MSPNTPANTSANTSGNIPGKKTASTANYTLNKTTLKTPHAHAPLEVAYEYCKQATSRPQDNSKTNSKANSEINSETNSKTPPVVLALHGLGSDMLGGKIETTKTWALENGVDFARFDYPGHGQSSGDMVDFTMSQALDAALHLIDTILQKPVVVTGSSTGGWLALLLAKARPAHVKGLVTIANACDFTEDLYWQTFSKQEQENIKQKGFYEKRFDDGHSFKLGLALFEDGKKHLLFNADNEKTKLPGKLQAITCPVRLLHGTDDIAVPWPTSVRVAKELGSGDVEVRIVPHADHRFSEPQNLRVLTNALESLPAISTNKRD